MDFLGPSVPLSKGQKIHREIHSKIHNKIPAKFTHVVKSGVGKSTLQEEGPDIFGLFPHFRWDAAFLLTVGSFLLTVELFYLQLTILASLLTVGAFLLTVLASLLTVGALLLTVGSASKKGR